MILNSISFFDRFSKWQVMLDKLAIEMEKSKLMDENVKLRTALGRYLDGITLSEKAKAKYNALMVHNHPSSFSNMCVFLLKIKN